jgi:hypothetical protein
VAAFRQPIAADQAFVIADERLFIFAVLQRGMPREF